VISQFAGTSLWFAGNAILPDINQQLQLGPGAIGNITSAVQFGFIAGTLLFALLSIADRFHASIVFFISSFLAALSNICIVWLVKDEYGLLACRFLTGFFLAGIYPVGMKIAADWFDKGLGKALGWLVGALVLGTAFPYLLRSSSWYFPWEEVLIVISLFAFAGGILMLLFVKQGPFQKKSTSFRPSNIGHIFSSRDFRAAAFGYFGHMWELYTFWAFVPVILAMHYNGINTGSQSFLSFLIIAAGCVSCIAGGYLSQKIGSAKIAFYSLIISGACCFLSYFFINSATPIFFCLMIIWGLTVISDSPQFSALVAQTAPQDYRGTALTFVTSVGFSITIISIQLMNYILVHIKEPLREWVFILLSIGPVIGIVSMRRLTIKSDRVLK
jgi:MFS family permease